MHEIPTDATLLPTTDATLLPKIGDGDRKHVKLRGSLVDLLKSNVRDRFLEVTHPDDLAIIEDSILLIISMESAIELIDCMLDSSANHGENEYNLLDATGLRNLDSFIVTNLGESRVEGVIASLEGLSIKYKNRISTGKYGLMNIQKNIARIRDLLAIIKGKREQICRELDKVMNG